MSQSRFSRSCPSFARDGFPSSPFGVFCRVAVLISWLAGPSLSFSTLVGWVFGGGGGGVWGGGLVWGVVLFGWWGWGWGCFLGLGLGGFGGVFFGGGLGVLCGSEQRSPSAVWGCAFFFFHPGSIRSTPSLPSRALVRPFSDAFSGFCRLPKRDLRLPPNTFLFFKDFHISHFF